MTVLTTWKTRLWIGLALLSLLFGAGTALAARPVTDAPAFMTLVKKENPAAANAKRRRRVRTTRHPLRREDVVSQIKAL